MAGIQVGVCYARVMCVGYYIEDGCVLCVLLTFHCFVHKRHTAEMPVSGSAGYCVLTFMVPMVSHSLHYFLIWHVQLSLRHSLTVGDKEMKKFLKVIVYTTVVVIVVYCVYSQSSRSHC